MQSQKSRGGSSSSGVSPATPRSTRTAKNAASDSDSGATPPHNGSRLSLDRSPRSSPKPKIPEHKSPRSPLSEKRATKASELQQQVAQAQEELKKTKEQLIAAESGRAQALEVQEELKKTKEQLVAAETVSAQALESLEETKKLREETAAKLEESEKRALDITENGTAQLAGLQQAYEEASKEREMAWQSQLEAVKRQHSMDVAALMSTTQELQRVKQELSIAMDSRTLTIAQVEQANMEIDSLKLEIANLRIPEPNLSDAHAHLENLRSELKDAKASEARAFMAARDAHLNLEEARMKMNTAKVDEKKAMESLRQVSAELVEANAGLKNAKCELGALTETAQGLKAELEKARSELVESKKREAEGEERIKKAVESLELDLHQATAEVGHLKIDLEAAYEEAQQARLEAEQMKAMLEGAERNFQAMLSEVRAEADCGKEAAMRAKMDVDEYAALSNERECKLMEALRETGAKANETKEESEKIKLEVTDLKASLMDKETELQNILEENESLKSNETARLEKIAQLEKSLAMAKKSESSEANNNGLDQESHRVDALAQEKMEEALDRAASADARENEALEKLKVYESELENSSQRANRAIEQLEAAQAANLAMETDMKRLRIQTEQWKKAADAAATVLAAAHNGELNGKVVERSASLLSDSDVLNMRFSSPMKDDFDTSPNSKKKKAMLKKIGDLWKKRGQK